MMIRTCVASLLVVLYAAAAHGNLVEPHLAGDGDGAIDCTSYGWTYQDDAYQINVDGVQHWGPGHILDTLITDTALDPSLRIINSIDNDTGMVWTSYVVNIYLSTTFSISGAAALSPGDWTTSVVQPVFDGTRHKGVITMTGGTPVPDGGTFDFKYTITFNGATSYQFCQELVPAPEPATLALLALGGGAGVLLRRRRA